MIRGKNLAHKKIFFKLILVGTTDIRIVIFSSDEFRTSTPSFAIIVDVSVLRNIFLLAVTVQL